MAILNSLLFTFSSFTLLGSFLYYKKSEKTLRFANWFVMSIPLLMCYFTSIQALLKLVSLPFNLIYFLIFNCILSAFFIYQIFSHGNKQKYSYKKSDFILLISLTVIAMVVFFKQFSFNLDIVYQTSDPGIHYGLAMDAIRNGETTGMFFSETNNALMISVFLPFLNSEFFAYKLFIINDGLMLLLSSAVFLVLINGFSNKSRVQKCCLFILNILYMLSYPLTNMIFGFNYLGMSVTIIALIMFILKQFRENLLKNNLAIILLAISCFSLSVCYMLFAPIIWVIVLFNIGIYFYRNKQLLTKEFVFTCLKIFLIPTILALKFCYFDYFDSRDLNLVSSISTEGGIYKNLFMNFIIFLPLFIYGIIHLFKRDKYNVSITFFFGFSIFNILFFILMYKGLVSEYYFFKIYFPFWLLFMVVVGKGISASLKNSFSTFISLGSAIPMMLILSFFGTSRYEMKNDANKLTDIYVYNKDKLTNKRIYWPELLKLYQFAIDNLKDKTQSVIPFFVDANNCEHWYWYEALSGEDSSQYYTWEIGVDGFLQKLNTEEFDYVITLKEDLLYLENIDYFSDYEIVFENEDGVIFKVN